MEVVEYIVDNYGVSLDVIMPVEIVDMGRSEFVIMLNDLNLTKGAEIGVLKGEFGEQICKSISNIEYYGIDTWTAYGNYIDYRRKNETLEYEQETVWDVCYEIAKTTLAPYNATLIRGYSTEIVNQFDDNSLDFVYIDGNHDLRHTVDDIDDWSKKVRPGGIIAGHDYWRRTKNVTIHVKDAVNSWTYLYGINPWFIFTKDHDPSWFWVKA